MMTIVFVLFMAVVVPNSLFAAEAETIARAQAAVSLAYAIATHTRPQITPPVQPKPETASPAQPTTYRVAYEAYTKRRQPMVVMVTASWCPYCPVVKSQLQAMQRDKQLREAALVILDFDQDQALARQVMGNHRTLPFVVLFTHEANRPRTYRQISLTQLKKRLPTPVPSPSQGEG